MANATIARSKFVPLIDITRGAEAGVHTWKPIDLSTVFELAYNPQTETYGYICNDTDSTEIKSYQPAMEQEIKISRGNPIYDFMLDFMRGMPTGSAAEVPVMVVYPDKTLKNSSCFTSLMKYSLRLLSCSEAMLKIMVTSLTSTAYSSAAAAAFFASDMPGS